MKTGALVTGLIGALIALLYGVVGFGLGSLANLGGSGEGTALQVLSILLPLVGLLGAGMAKAKPIVAAVLMGIAAIGLIIILGFNFFTMIPVILLGLGALFDVLSLQEKESHA